MNLSIMRLFQLMSLCLFGLQLLACSSDPYVPESAGACEEPRPEMCTREYRPVCGVQQNSLAKSYGNACEACADEKVGFYIEGACRGKKPN